MSEQNPVNESHLRGATDSHARDLVKSITASQGQPVGGENPQYVQSAIVPATQTPTTPSPAPATQASAPAATTGTQPSSNT